MGTIHVGHIPTPPLYIYIYIYISLSLLFSPWTSLFLSSFLLRWPLDQPASVTTLMHGPTRSTRKASKRWGPTSSQLKRQRQAATWRLEKSCFHSFEMVIFSRFLRQFSASTCSFHPLIDVCALNFWRKCPDRWHIFLYNQSFALRSEPNGALFWGNNPKFILMKKNAFWWHIICLCLMPFAKKSYVSRQTVKIAS